MAGQILIKLILARNLQAEKLDLGFRYACDGPGRGGTCQISPWDHIYLIIAKGVSIEGFYDTWASVS